MPCDAIEQAEIGAVLPCYTMLYLFLPYSTPSDAFGCLRHVHCIAHLVACNSLQPALKHQHVLQRSSLQARNDAIRGIIDFIHGDGLNTAILRILRAMCRTTGIWERCNFRWMHQFTQVYTSLHCGKWETWETELWMNPEPHHPQYPQMIPDAINIYIYINKYAMITAHHRYHRHWQITAAQWPSCCAEPQGWQTRSSDSPSQHRWSRQFLRVRCPKPMGVWQCVVWSNSDNLW